MASIVGGARGCPNVVDEAEQGPRDGVRPGVGSNGVRVLAGQSISHCVRLSWTVFHSEVEAEDLVDPLMLRHGGETLIKQELKGEVVGADEEAMP